VLDDILRILEDGKWHRCTDISDETRVSEDKVLYVARFLNEFGFADFEHEEKRVKLDTDFLKLPV